MSAARLLQAGDPAPVVTIRPDGPGDWLFLCDHADRVMPRRLGKLGLCAVDLQRHIAYDIGIAPVADALAARLGAPLVKQVYSRLVIDCNRAPGHPTSIPPLSEATPIPGNAGIDAAEAAARVDEIFAPYHAAIAAELDRLAAAGREPIVVAMHSFTPAYLGIARPWQAGVLYNRHSRFARLVGALLAEDAGLIVGDNEPYRLTDSSDYTIPHHAERRGLPYLELEIRQDLIAEPAGQRDWTERLARVLPEAARRLGTRRVRSGPS